MECECYRSLSDEGVALLPYVYSRSVSWSPMLPQCGNADGKLTANKPVPRRSYGIHCELRPGRIANITGQDSYARLCKNHKTVRGMAECTKPRRSPIVPPAVTNARGRVRSRVFHVGALAVWPVDENKELERRSKKVSHADDHAPRREGRLAPCLSPPHPTLPPDNGR